MATIGSTGTGYYSLHYSTKMLFGSLGKKFGNVRFNSDLSGIGLLWDNLNLDSKNEYVWVEGKVFW